MTLGPPDTAGANDAADISRDLRQRYVYIAQVLLPMFIELKHASAHQLPAKCYLV